MSTNSLCPTAAPVAPVRSARFSESSGMFATASLVGAGFAGFVTHSRTQDLLTVSMVAGMVFVGAFVGLHLLQIVFHVLAQLVRIAVPVGIVLAIGCALDWHWAEMACGWLRDLAGKGLALASQALIAIRAR